MSIRLTHRIVWFLAAGVALASCRTTTDPARPQIVQPGAPGQSTRVVEASKAADVSAVQFTAADVQFMQGMISHHAQAVEMTGLLQSRTESEDMRLLARRIELSQSDEIKMMREWLAARGQAEASEQAHHAHHQLMPGMLAPEEMDRLAAARGAGFDRLFLEGMIKHHEGALVMVQQLFATPGAGQEPDIFAFTADVDADQRMEIDRMRSMLAAPDARP